MKTSGNGKKLLIEWEGLKTSPYKDSGGALTIGVGHLLTADEKLTGLIRINDELVSFYDGLTEEQCMRLLEQDLKRFERVVNNHVKVTLSQNQFDALVSFAFNVGTEAFKNSTLLRLLNQGQHDQVTAQLRRWVKVSGKTVQGLVNRREKEINLWSRLT